MVCFLKRPSATSLRVDRQVLETVCSHKVLQWSGYPGKSEVAWVHLYDCIQGNTSAHQLLKCRGGVSQVQWTLPLAARSLTFCPRVHCCVAWYNALPAHLPSKIERVQMRALRIIYLRKLYSLFKSLDLRTGAVSSVWALWKYLQKAGPCQPAMKQHLSIYFIFLFIKYLQYISVFENTHKK